MGRFVSDMWEHNNRAEITWQRWSQFDSIRTLKLFVCSENTTAQQPEQIALICAAWQQVPKHCLSKKQSMVSYFYVLSTVLALFSRAFRPSLFFVPSAFINFTLYMCGVQHLGNVLISPNVNESMRLFTSSLHQVNRCLILIAVFVGMTMSHNAKCSHYA